MNITVATKTLQEVLDMAGRFVSKHSTLPVLENIYIKGNIDTLVFRATDMEKYIDIEIPAKIDDEGSITVNAKTFGEIVKNIDDDSINLTIDGGKDILNIKTSEDDFKLKGIPASEYVAVPEVGSSNRIEIDPRDFSKGISKVEYTVTERNFSPVLTGILMRLKNYSDGNKLVFVGTDSFRLSEYKIGFAGEMQSMDLIVPKVNINDIKKVSDYFIEKGGEKMYISFSDNLVSFSFNINDMKILTTSMLISGNFPDYENESVIPTQYNGKIVLDKSTLEKAIRKISILTKDINNFIELETEERTLKIKSGETDMGEAKTQLVAYVEGEPLTLGVNGKYILDYLRSLESDEVTINIVNSERPMVFKESDGGDYVYVVRPLVK